MFYGKCKKNVQIQLIFVMIETEGQNAWAFWERIVV